MAGPAAILREIHRLRAFAQELQSRIDLGPKQHAAQQGVVAKREEELKQGQEAVKKLKIAVHEHEVSVKAESQQVKKYEQQLNDIHSKKEYDALKHEIASAQEKMRALEDETLTAMLELDECANQLPALDKAVKTAKAEYAECESKNKGQIESWIKQRDEAIQQIAAEEAKLSDDIRPQYQRLVKAMGADALASVEGKICAACYTELTTQLYHNVLKQQFVLCWNCGRVLYQKDAK
jgi:uncharacterized protein